MTRETIPMVTTRKRMHPDHGLLAIALRDADSHIINPHHGSTAFDRDGAVIVTNLDAWDLFVAVGAGGDEDLAVVAVEGGGLW